MTSHRLAVFASLALFTAAGCTVGPNYRVPQTSMPASFDTGPTTMPTTAPSTASTTQPQVDLVTWWKSLGDPELNSLIERAIANNLDLRIALTRLQEARTQENIVGGGAWPQLNFSAGAARGTGSDSVRGRVNGPLHAAENTSGLKEITHAAGFDATWEIDLFGRYRREMEGAKADTESVAAIRNAVLISLIGEVARAYVDQRSLRMRLEVAQQSLAIFQQSVDLTAARLAQGIAAELDVALARRQLASVQATIAPLHAAIAQSQRRIAVLLGRMPQELDAELQLPGALPDPPAEVQPGLPVDLLRRRPDIVESERDLAASTARLGVAISNLYPRVSLIGAFGVQGQGLGRTPVSYKSIWSLGPSLYWPVLDFGTLDSIIQRQDLRTRELLYNYQRTVLEAVEEVDNAISNYAAQRDRLDRLDAAVLASQRAVQLATQGYEGGFTDYLNVLDAQRQLYDLQDQQAVARQTVTTQYIALYKSLGGGWENYQQIPAIRAPQPAIIAAGREVIAPTTQATR